MTQKTNPWIHDVRVRERNLKAGTITEKDIEKYISTLPDLADQAEPFGTSQPALAQPQIVEEDLGDDEDDDDDLGGDEPGDAGEGEGGGGSDGDAGDGSVG
jgi:hypothetical protein